MAIETKEIAPLGIQELTTANIELMAQQANDLVIGADGSGYKDVERFHKDAKSLHLRVRKREEELLVPFKEEMSRIKTDMQKVKDVSLKIQNQLNPIITVLGEKRDKWETVLAERKAEAERIEQERVDIIRSKISAMAEITIGMNSLNSNELRALIAEIESVELSPEEYQEFIAEANSTKHKVFCQASDALENRLKFEAEAAERSALAEKLRLQREAQEAEAKRLEAIRLEQEAKEREEREKIDAERRKIEKERADFEAEKKAEQDRIEREALERRLAEEAKAKAEAELKARLEREEAARIAKIEADKKEAERLEALKPDKERLMDFANRIRAVEHPVLMSEEADGVLNHTLVGIESSMEWIEEFCE